ncbi:MAG: FkbM family methyltransferase [Candidatus Thermoplasmatota archaeon]|jgi:FkbM family methyltransferase|nr:FkbM family methyltransferase [Candidatus Thermoplasmatota archaeon]MCL5790621.1 FkbM family methyltransferase [Candidatus Thermoplasmatota archaeon]
MIHKKDIKWAIHTFKETPYYPWEIFSKSGRKKRYERLNRNLAIQVEKRLSEIGMKVPIGWSDIDKVQIHEVLVEDPYSFPGLSPKSVVDVGAKYGEFAVLSILKGAKEAYAFEPLLSNFQKLQELIETNHVHMKAENIALGEFEEETELRIDSDRIGAMITQFGTGTKIRIKVRPLDSYNLSGIDLLKIDVEGMEMPVLKGAVSTMRRNKPSIAIEVHSKILKSEVQEFLSKEGYVQRYESTPSKGEGKMDLLQILFFSPK